MMLSVELTKRQPGNENVSLKTLEKQIKYWLAHKNIIIQCVTHVAQNTRLDKEKILAFLSTSTIKLLATFEFTTGNFFNIDTSDSISQMILISKWRLVAKTI